MVSQLQNVIIQMNPRGYQKEHFARQKQNNVIKNSKQITMNFVGLKK